MQTINRVVDVFPAHQQQQVRTQLSFSLEAVFSQQLLPTSTGRGRAMAAETMIVTPAIRALVREGKTHQIISSMQIGAKEGMRLMNDVLFDHVAAGRIEPMEAYMKCAHKDDMRGRLEGAGHKIEAVHAVAPKLAPQHPPGPPAPMPRNVPPPSAAQSAARPAAAPASAPPPVPATAEPAPEAAAVGAKGGEGYVDPFEEFRKKRGTR